MSCQTCSGTMQCLRTCSFAEPGIFWCPRCGSIRLQTDIINDRSGDAVPSLVGRCREFAKTMATDAVKGTSKRQWHSLGIAESIGTPKPTTTGSIEFDPPMNPFPSHIGWVKEGPSSAE